MSILPPPPGAKADLTAPDAGNGQVDPTAAQPQAQAQAADGIQLWESFRSALQGLINDAGGAAQRAEAAKTLDATAELKGNVYPLLSRAADVLGRQFINALENVMIPGIVQAMLPHLLQHILPDMLRELVPQVLDEMAPSDRLTPEFAEEIKDVIQALVADIGETIDAKLSTRVSELLLAIDEAIDDDFEDDGGEEDPEGGELEPAPPMPQVTS